MIDGVHIAVATDAAIDAGWIDSDLVPWRGLFRATDPVHDDGDGVGSYAFHGDGHGCGGGPFNGDGWGDRGTGGGDGWGGPPRGFFDGN